MTKSKKISVDVDLNPKKKLRKITAGIDLIFLSIDFDLFKKIDQIHQINAEIYLI